MNMPGFAERITRPARFLALSSSSRCFSSASSTCRDSTFALDCGSSSVSTAMSVSGNDSVSVVVAAMRNRIPQQSGSGGRPDDAVAVFAIRRPVEDDIDKSSCSACGTWWRLPLLLAVVLAAIVVDARPRHLERSRRSKLTTVGETASGGRERACFASDRFSAMAATDFDPIRMARRHDGRRPVARGAGHQSDANGLRRRRHF